MVCGPLLAGGRDSESTTRFFRKSITCFLAGWLVRLPSDSHFTITTSPLVMNWKKDMEDGFDNKMEWILIVFDGLSEYFGGKINIHNLVFVSYMSWKGCSCGHINE